MSTPPAFPPEGFVVISAAPVPLPLSCTYVRGFVADPRRDAIGILVLESDDPTVTVGEVRHLFFAPHLCELESLQALLVEETITDAEGNASTTINTAEVALRSACPPGVLRETNPLKNWSIALKLGDPVRMEAALQAVLAAREASKTASAPAVPPVPATPEKTAEIVVTSTPAIPSP